MDMVRITRRLWSGANRLRLKQLMRDRNIIIETRFDVDRVMSRHVQSEHFTTYYENS